MPEIFDIYDDPTGSVLKVIATERPIPGFVKSASFGIGPVGRKTKKAFAWPEERRFPIDTPQDLYTSVLYFEKTANKIPSWKRQEIKEVLDEAVNLSGMYIEPVTKVASLEPEIPIEHFSIRIKAANLPADFRTKYADFIYMDNFVLYPMGNEAQVKEANALFPHGLDEELEYFRPFIAQDIMKRLPADVNLNPKVANYAPIPASVVYDQLELRAYTAPHMAKHYEKLKDMLSLNPFNRAKFANFVSTVDKQAGLEYLYNTSLMNPDNFMRGIVQDTEKTAYVILNGNKYEFMNIQKAASNLEQYFPNIKPHLATPKAFISYVEKQSSAVQSLLATVIHQ